MSLYSSTAAPLMIIYRQTGKPLAYVNCRCTLNFNQPTTVCISRGSAFFMLRLLKFVAESVESRIHTFLGTCNRGIKWD